MLVVPPQLASMRGSSSTHKGKRGMTFRDSLYLDDENTERNEEGDDKNAIGRFSIGYSSISADSCSAIYHASLHA